MRHVQPKIYLVSETKPVIQSSVDASGLQAYLNSFENADVDRYTDEVIGADYDGRAYRPEFMVEVGGRLCYRSWAPGLNTNVTRIRADQDAYFANVLKSGHGSVLEHTSFGFILQNVSRVITHELVRHRAGCAFSQESLRFVRLDDIKMWLPDWVDEDPELLSRILDHVDQAEELQLWMAAQFGLDDEGVSFHEKKHKTSFMRRLAPGGLATDILVTANVRAWRHMIAVRTALGAEEEIRLVFGMIARILKERCPSLFQDMTRDIDGTCLFEHDKV